MKQYFEQQVYNDPQLRRAIGGLYQKYGAATGEDPTTFTQTMLMEAYLVMERFEFMDGDTWANVSFINRKRLFKTINTRLGHSAHEWANNTKSQKVNGRTVSVSLAPASIDNVDFPIEAVSSFWANHLTENQAQHRMSHFNEWFMENYKDILTPTQVKFVETYAQALPSEYVLKNDFQDITGVSTRNRKARINNINKRVLEAYRPSTISPELADLNHVHELINNEDNIHNMNTLLRQWLSMRINKEWLTNLYADHLVGQENSEVNTYISTPLLYKIAGLLERRREVLLANSTYTPQKIKSTFERKPQHKEPMFGECKVYKASTGEFLRIETACEPKSTNKKVYELTAQGVEAIDNVIF